MNFRLQLSALCLVTPLVAQTPQLDWQLEANPPSRSSTKLVHHAGIGATMLFGGYLAGAINDTWLWQDGWRRVETGTAPSPRYDYSVTYDSLRGRIVLVGGRNGNQIMDDTWVFDGTTWTNLNVTTPQRFKAGLAYDSGRDRVVLKGGFGVGFSGTDVWEFDGTSWQLIPQTAPPGSTGHLVYDAARSETLHWNGLVHAWDGVTWTPRSNVGLPGSLESELHYDPIGERVLVANPLTSPSAHAAGLYEYTGQDWTLVSATPPVSSLKRSMALETATGRIIGFQHVTHAGTNLSSDTWMLDNGVWQRALRGLPFAQQEAAMCYDRDRHRIVLQGGRTTSNSSRLHEADGPEWTLASPSSAFSRWDHAMVYDEQAQATLILGGSYSPSPQIVSWDGNSASYINPAIAAPARWGHGFAFDSLRSRSILFGGRSQSTTFGDLWSWDGSVWQELNPTQSPSPRRDAALSYDRDRDRIVLFGGFDGTSYLGDTWEFDGSEWMLMTPANAPSPRQNHVQVYHEQLQRTLLFGGYDDASLRDTWLWDGQDWTQLTTATIPDSGRRVTGAYDSDRQEVVLFGGLDPNEYRFRGEVWRLKANNAASWQASGTGCSAGNGALQLSGSASPRLGSTVDIDLQNTPTSFLAMPIGWLGFSNSSWSGFPLPTALAALGSPNCFVWATADVHLPMLPLGTHAVGQLFIPDVPAALGMELFVQGAVWDFASSTIATANLLTGTLGYE